jgi:hypothetical protein
MSDEIFRMVTHRSKMIHNGSTSMPPWSDGFNIIPLKKWVWAWKSVLYGLTLSQICCMHEDQEPRMDSAPTRHNRAARPFARSKALLLPLVQKRLYGIINRFSMEYSHTTHDVSAWSRTPHVRLFRALKARKCVGGSTLSCYGITGLIGTDRNQLQTRTENALGPDVRGPGLPHFPLSRFSIDPNIKG